MTRHQRAQCHVLVAESQCTIALTSSLHFEYMDTSGDEQKTRNYHIGPISSISLPCQSLLSRASSVSDSLFQDIHVLRRNDMVREVQFSHQILDIFK